MNQTAHHTLSGQFFQNGRKVAQTHTAQDDFSDGKFSPDEMIEGDAARDHVAAGKTRSHVEVVFSFNGSIASISIKVTSRPVPGSLE